MDVDVMTDTPDQSVIDGHDGNIVLLRTILFC